MDRDSEKLVTVAPFSSLTVEAIESLCKRNPPVSFESGQIIALRGADCTALHVLLEGQLEADLIDYKGNVLKLETLHGPCLVASSIPFSSDPQFPVQLSAASDGAWVTIPLDTIFSLAQSSRDFLRLLMADGADKLQFLAEKIRFLRFATLEEKLASYLLDQGVRQGSRTVKLPKTHEYLAQLFGCTRPSLSRSLGKLVEGGWIQRTEGAYVLGPLEQLLE